MLDASPGYAFGDALTGEEVTEPKDYRGTHGHLPTRAELRSSLIIFGPGARVGAQMALARMIRHRADGAALLGLSFSEAEGQPDHRIDKARADTEIAGGKEEELRARGIPVRNENHRLHKAGP